MKKGLIFLKENLYITFMEDKDIEIEQNQFLNYLNNENKKILKNKNITFDELKSILSKYEIINKNLNTDNKIEVICKEYSTNKQEFKCYNFLNEFTGFETLPLYYQIFKMTISTKNVQEIYDIEEIEVLEIDSNFEPCLMDISNIDLELAKNTFKQNKFTKMLSNLIGENNIQKIEFEIDSLSIYHSIPNNDLKDYLLDDLNILFDYYFDNSPCDISCQETLFDDVNMLQVKVAS